MEIPVIGLTCLIRLRFRGAAVFRTRRDSLVDQHGMNTGQEIIGRERLLAKDDIQAGVFRFRFHQTADYQNRQVRMRLTQRGDEGRAVHPGHDVIGDDELDLFGELPRA